MKTGTKLIKKEEFDLIKSLIGTGKKNAEIASFVGRSAATVLAIRNAQSFDAYLEYNRNRNGLRKKNMLEPAKTKLEATLEPTFIAQVVNDHFNAINEKLDIIIANQNAIANSSNRRGLWSKK